MIIGENDNRRSWVLYFEGHLWACCRCSYFSLYVSLWQATYFRPTISKHLSEQEPSVVCVRWVFRWTWCRAWLSFQSDVLVVVRLPLHSLSVMCRSHATGQVIDFTTAALSNQSLQLSHCIWFSIHKYAPGWTVGLTAVFLVRQDVKRYCFLI